MEQLEYITPFANIIKSLIIDAIVYRTTGQEGSLGSVAAEQGRRRQPAGRAWAHGPELRLRAQVQRLREDADQEQRGTRHSGQFRYLSGILSALVAQNFLLSHQYLYYSRGF